ncbi:unnamed protein product, partial [Didymodactylos carnosus]
IKNINHRLRNPMEKSKKTGCSKFVAQEWNANKCRECFRAKQDHEHQSVATSNDSQVPINRRPLSVRHLSSNDTPANNYSSKTTFREPAGSRETSAELTARHEGGPERRHRNDQPTAAKKGQYYVHI